MVEFLAGAYILFLIAVVFYLFRLFRYQNKLEKRIELLEKSLSDKREGENCGEGK